MPGISRSTQGFYRYISEKSHYRLDPELVKENIDENTIGIFVILGSTSTGHYEPVEEISKILDEYEQKTGLTFLFTSMPPAEVSLLLLPMPRLVDRSGTIFSLIAIVVW